MYFGGTEMVERTPVCPKMSNWSRLLTSVESVMDLARAR